MKLNIGKSGGGTSCFVGCEQSSYAHHDASHLCKNIFNNKLCSVGGVGPACSSRNLVGALVATCPGASEMALPAGTGLKNICGNCLKSPAFSLNCCLNPVRFTRSNYLNPKRSKCVSKQSKPM